MINDDRATSAPVTRWMPPHQLRDSARLTDFQQWLGSHRQLSFSTYEELWRWSVTELGAFWEAIWEYFDVRAHTPAATAVEYSEILDAQWFAGAQLNYAEHALRHADDGIAIIDVHEDGDPVEITWRQLRGQVGALSKWLAAQGVTPGDRVVGYVASTSEAVVAFLACASIGAVWSSCSPEYAPAGAADRFAQLDPVVLLASASYRYRGKPIDCIDRVIELAALLPTVRATLWIGTPDAGQLPSGAATYADIVATPDEPVFTAVDFDHPLWVLYSSGTTGRPKGIVHGHGGILLEHLKFLALHCDVRAGDRFFWFATTSWMVWNMQVSGLLLGATIVTYDGCPTWPDVGRLWEIAANLGIEVFGSSASYLINSKREGVDPGNDYKLSQLRAVGSTGSPLPAAAYTWIHQSLPDVWLASASGGTDVCSGFAGGVPTEPVVPGELQARLLGVPLDSWDDNGRPVRSALGELVLTGPMPSMPLRFWGDDGTRYREAYYSTYPGIWRHGDWVTITDRGTVIIHGRSDATLNRYGVRFGCAEIYAAVETLPAITDSLVVGVERPDGTYWMPLFVTLAADIPLTDELSATIADTIKTLASPRHVPDEVIVAPALPHTLTGKRLEVPIKRILQGTPVATAVNPTSVDRPEVLTWFADVALRRQRAARDAAD